MKITIKNQKDLNRFYNKLFLYKHMNRDFTIESSIKDEDLDIIIKILNLNKKERLSYIYDYICNCIDTNYVFENFCEFKCDKCLKERNSNNINGCCGKCKYLIDGKCSINAISCKIYFCSYIKRKKKIFKLKQIKFLKYFLNIKTRIIFTFDVFKSKEEVLKDIKKPLLLWCFTKTERK